MNQIFVKSPEKIFADDCIYSAQTIIKSKKFSRFFSLEDDDSFLINRPADNSNPDNRVKIYVLFNKKVVALDSKCDDTLQIKEIVGEEPLYITSDGFTFKFDSHMIKTVIHNGKIRSVNFLKNLDL